MKCQSLFSGKNKKNIIKLSSSEFVQRVLKIILATKKPTKNIFSSCLNMEQKSMRKYYEIKALMTMFLTRLSTFTLVQVKFSGQ